MKHNDFDTWMKQVDAEIDARCGMTSGDLPDWMYRDAFEDGTSPKSAARQAISAAKE